jgi:hypothetical protein
MATRERERRRHDDGESDSQKHYDSLPFHENMISSKAHDVNIKLQF